MRAVKKGDLVRYFFDDGRGGSYVYGIAVTNGTKRPTVCWESGLVQRVPIHCLDAVTPGTEPEGVLQGLQCQIRVGRTS